MNYQDLPTQPSYDAPSTIAQPEVEIQTPTPKKKSGRNLYWSIALVVVFFLGVMIGSRIKGNANNDVTTPFTLSDISIVTATHRPSSPAPTPTPTHALTGQTIHTYQGNGAQKTETITVPSDWKLQWTCDPTSFYSEQYNVIVTVTNPDGTPVDLAINTLCKDGNTSGSTEEHQSGKVYFDIDSEAAWTLTVQKLK